MIYWGVKQMKNDKIDLTFNSFLSNIYIYIYIDYDKINKKQLTWYIKNSL
jgi:hypothetical protein